MDEGLPTPITRPRRGRLLGGVCAGLATRWDVPAGRVRLGFVAAGVVLGLGVMVYVAAWLIFPGESEDGRGQRGIVLLAQACGALLGLATLAVAGTLATVFGFGWVIVALAGAILVGTLAGWAKLGPAWALLPVGALVLPSAALAIGGVHVEPSVTPARHTFRSTSELAPEYKSGLATLTLDLRKAAWPERGTVPLKIDAGVRRTLIALPHDRCVRVQVASSEVSDLAELGNALLGRASGTPAPRLFGPYGIVDESRSGSQVFFEGPQDVVRPGPTLSIDYSTLGGELVVRDYPDDVDPVIQPDWPGYEVYPEARPDTTGLTATESRRLIAEWRERRAAQVADRTRIRDLMQGPCAQPEPKKQRKKKKAR